jgi:hypothetical protein
MKQGTFLHVRAEQILTRSSIDIYNEIRREIYFEPHWTATPADCENQTPVSLSSLPL